MEKVGYIPPIYFANHKPNDIGHLEKPERLDSLDAFLSQKGILSDLITIEPQLVENKYIEQVHDVAYVAKLKRIARKTTGKNWHLDRDTYFSKNTLDIALLAAGAACSGVDAIASDTCQNVFCAIRPPGHHAGKAKSGGFCLLNNVAVATKYAQSKYGYGRIMIIDWDLHHGNGTQEIFYKDPTVYYLSTHLYSKYPGTGYPQQKGKDEGYGYNANWLLGPGMGDAQYLELFKSSILNTPKYFTPDLVMLSAGFDMHKLDPMSNLNISSELFKQVTIELKKTYGRTPIISVLEGGYNPTVLAESIYNHIVGLMIEN